MFKRQPSWSLDKSRGDVYHELISVLTVDIYIFQLGLTQPRASSCLAALQETFWKALVFVSVSFAGVALVLILMFWRIGLTSMPHWIKLLNASAFQQHPFVNQQIRQKQKSIQLCSVFLFFVHSLPPSSYSPTIIIPLWQRSIHNAQCF